MFDSLPLLIYHLGEWATELVNSQLTHLSLVSLSVVGLAGLVTSLSPCLLSMLPIMVGYMGGYEVKNQWQASLRSLGFGLGLAT
ncbi:MAG: cytochrome c biogenesis protein CcdA, partial [Nodosilinea sp.]